MARNRKGTFAEVFSAARRVGYSRAREWRDHPLEDEPPTLSKKLKHSIDIVTDRITIANDTDTLRRLHDSVEATLRLGEGSLIVSESGRSEGMREYMVSEKRACTDCGVAFPEPEPPRFRSTRRLACARTAPAWHAGWRWTPKRSSPIRPRAFATGDRAVGHNDGSRRRLGLQDHPGSGRSGYGIDPIRPGASCRRKNRSWSRMATVSARVHVVQWKGATVTAR